MSLKRLNRMIAFGMFAVSLVTYSITLSPTVVFWDVGEFCAAAYTLQVPHPPGAPLFLLIARVTSMIPFVSDVAVRMHFISAFASAVTIMFLYLITVRFLTMFRGTPATLAEKLTVYGSAVVAALALTFSKTFWFNAVEAEVYGLSMFFVSGILWLGLRWYERAEWSRSDVYLLLIAYLVGMSVGVHLLAILTVFVVLLLVYFRWYEFSIVSFVKFGAAAVLIFGMIYPIVVKEFPSMLDGEIGGEKSEIFSFIPYIAVFGALYGVYYTIQKRNRRLNVALLAFLFIVLGYSTYTMVYIRANAKPPMNENDPSTISRLVSYLNREQYGSQPFIQRRWDPDPEKQVHHRKYTSDFDFLWRFQFNHMYIRYFGRNFVGAAWDEKDAGVNWNKLFGIPLLLGLFGAYEHWRRDPKMAFVNTALFVIMGVALVMYFNMQEPQPRERDYFYVGSFFAFAVWIGIGVAGLVDAVREFVKRESAAMPVAAGTVALALVFVPVNMARVNYHEANRTGNYVAWDYSYNLLQSCEQDAILFTNGDNDTFPLWYLQDVEGVRRDIRIVNLSLLNTNWYIKQLKHEMPYGSKRVPISSSDVDIERIEPIRFDVDRVMELPVGPDVVRMYAGEQVGTGELDTNVTKRGVIRFTMSPTLSFGNVRALRVQDIMVYDIIRTSAWKRPVYFAMTVSDDGKIGLRDYMQLRGLAFKFVPRKGPFYQNMDVSAIRTHLFTDIAAPTDELQQGFLWRGLSDSTTYFDEDSRRLVMSNYRNLFMTLAEYFIYTARSRDEGIRVLDRLEQVIPRSVIGMEPGMKYRLGLIYGEANRKTDMTSYLSEVVADVSSRRDEYLKQQLTQYNPLIVLFYSYLELARFDEADALLSDMKGTYGTEQGLGQAFQQLQMQLMSRRAALASTDTTTK